MKKKILIYIIIYLVVVILIFTLRFKKLFFPEKIIKDVYVISEQIFYKPIFFITEKIKSLNNNEYKNLKDKEIELELLKNSLTEKDYQINELKELNNITYTHDCYTTLSATVINRNANSFYDNLTINVGEKDGIKIGEAVVSSSGMIGVIENTSYFSSTVRLLTSNYKASVKIISNENEIYGILKQYKDGFYIVEGISENTVIEPNMKVLTTGLTEDIPSGLLIGYVEKIMLDHFELNRTVYVKPIDMDKINYVKVIKKV